MRVSLIVVGVSGLIAGLATWFVVKLQRAELEQSTIEEEKYRRESDERIKAAEARTAEAKKETAELQTWSTKRVMPRDLFVTRSAINAALADKPTGRVEILWKKSVADGQQIARAIVSGFMGFDPFKGPHWKIERVESIDELPEEARPTGLTVIGRRGGKFVFSMFPNPPTSDDPMDIVGSALMKGMDHDVLQVDAGFDRTLSDDLVRITIGPKP